MRVSNNVNRLREAYEYTTMSEWTANTHTRTKTQTDRCVCVCRHVELYIAPPVAVVGFVVAGLKALKLSTIAQR